MSDDQVTIGQWYLGVKDSDSDRHTDIGLVIVGAVDHSAFHRVVGVMSGRGDELIARLAASREHARLGGGTAGSGLGGDHPGVEWVTSLDEADERAFVERLKVHGMARLWVAPSIDGSTFALIDPNDEGAVLGHLESEQAADVLVWMIDMIITAGRA